METLILVFKCMLEGHIESQDFATYPCGCIYACQKFVWMDEVVMLQWVEQELKPQILEASVHVVPLLLLDSYMCRMIALVIMQINQLGLEVQQIPCGCTGLCQPVDVRVAKLLKDELINLWESCMIEEEEVPDGELLRENA